MRNKTIKTLSLTLGLLLAPSDLSAIVLGTIDIPDRFAQDMITIHNYLVSKIGPVEATKEMHKIRRKDNELDAIDDDVDIRVHALEKLNFAARDCEGFTGAEGLEYLEQRIIAKDEHAQKCMIDAARDKKLGFTDTTGREYLEKCINAKNQYAQQCMIDAARDDKLGFTDTTGREYLEKCINAKNKYAELAMRSKEIARLNSSKRTNSGVLDSLDSSHQHYGVEYKPDNNSHYR